MLSILPIQPLSDTEMYEIQELLAKPVVKKYLSSLATGLATDILTSRPQDSENDALYMRRLEHYKGQLAALETLLSINKEQ